MVDLTGVRVLVCEPEAITAIELANCLTDVGAEMAGIALKVASARSALRSERPIHAAVLEWSYRDGVISSIAAELALREVPFLFFTDEIRSVRQWWPDHLIIPKFQMKAVPAGMAELVKGVPADARMSKA